MQAFHLTNFSPHLSGRIPSLLWQREVRWQRSSGPLLSLLNRHNYDDDTDEDDNDDSNDDDDDDDDDNLDDDHNSDIDYNSSGYNYSNTQYK